tara:strand:+ start:712 stop:957 length:246 start_codon:yes stop_codon:yes gene_type:complete
MKKGKEYSVEEWSVDTRRWEIYSPRALTHEEVFEIYNEHIGYEKNQLLSGKFDGITIYFVGTKYGDDSQYEINGDFKEEEE